MLKFLSSFLQPPTASDDDDFLDFSHVPPGEPGADLRNKLTSNCDVTATKPVKPPVTS